MKSWGGRPVALSAIRARAVAPRPGSRQTITISAPTSASRWAVANPTPLLAPVTTTVLLCMSIMLCSVSVVLTFGPHGAWPNWLVAVAGAVGALSEEGDSADRRALESADAQS